MGILSRTRNNEKKNGIFDKLKGKVKSGVESAQKTAQERKVYRDEINLIRKDEKIKQEKKHARFKVQEEYRQKRKKARTGVGGGGFSLDGLILGSPGGGSRGGDPMSDLILGPSKKTKTKRKKRKRSKTHPQVIVVVQEPKKRKRRKRKK